MERKFLNLSKIIEFCGHLPGGDVNDNKATSNSKAKICQSKVGTLLWQDLTDEYEILSSISPWRKRNSTTKVEFFLNFDRTIVHLSNTVWPIHRLFEVFHTGLVQSVSTYTQAWFLRNAITKTPE